MPKRITILRGVNEPGYRSDEIEVTLDAGALVNAVTKAVAEHHRKAIRAGEKASGGKQKSLSPEELKKARKGKRSATRGLGVKEVLPEYLHATKARGDLRATAQVAPVAFYDYWIEREHGRGVEYFYDDGDVDQVVEQVIEDELKRQGFTD